MTKFHLLAATALSMIAGSMPAFAQTTDPTAVPVTPTAAGAVQPDAAQTIDDDWGNEIIVTANRRHLVPRDLKEQGGAASSSLPGAGYCSGAGSRGEPWAINPRDGIDDALALADRFGLSLGFHVVDQDHYVAIVERYCIAHDLPFDGQEAIGWATKRGSRSGRVAWQYVTELAGRHGKSV